MKVCIDMNGNLELELDGTNGLAGFDELLDTLSCGKIPAYIVRYVASRIIRTLEQDPVKASTIVKAVNERYAFKITDATVRKIVSMCRCDLRIPIGSTSKGYFRAVRSDQLDKTIDHLTRRIKRITAALDEITKVQGFMRQRETKRTTAAAF